MLDFVASAEFCCQICPIGLLMQLHHLHVQLFRVYLADRLKWLFVPVIMCNSINIMIQKRGDNATSQLSYVTTSDVS